MRSFGDELAGNTLLRIPVAAGEKIQTAELVAVNADGYAVHPSVTAGLTAAGMARSDADNTAGADGGCYVDVQRGAFIFHNAGDIKETDLLKVCYFAGPDSVSLEGSGTSSAAGLVVYADAGSVGVDMAAAPCRTN